jgi:glycine/D-amino acid oxidase-like deaminating enzyme
MSQEEASEEEYILRICLYATDQRAHSLSAPLLRRSDSELELGYAAVPSLLFAGSAAGAHALEARSQTLAAAGARTELLSVREARAAEPSLHVPDDGAALRASDDAQIDATAASEYLLACCEELGRGKGRFEARFGVAVERLLMACCSVEISGVATSAGEFECRCALHTTGQTLSTSWRDACMGDVECTSADARAQRAVHALAPAITARVQGIERIQVICD